MAITQSTPNLAGIVWRPIPGWPAYEVSNAGDVRRAVAAKTRRAGGRLKPQPQRNGYLRVCLSRDGQAKARLIHRLVAAAFLGAPDGRYVHHKDNCPTHNHLDNLEYTTPQGNVAHMVAAGRQARGDRASYERRPRGARHPHAKLTDDAVREIRRLCAENVRSGVIAAQFGIDRTTVKRIRRGVAWQHVQ